MYFDTSTLPNDVVTKHGWRNSRYLKPKVEGNGTLTASLNYHRGDPEIVEVTFKTNVLNDLKNFLYCLIVFATLLSNIFHSRFLRFTKKSLSATKSLFISGEKISLLRLFPYLGRLKFIRNWS